MPMASGTFQTETLSSSSPICLNDWSKRRNVRSLLANLVPGSLCFGAWLRQRIDQINLGPRSSQRVAREMSGDARKHRSHSRLPAPIATRWRLSGGGLDPRLTGTSAEESKPVREGKKAKTKVTHQVLIELAIAARNGRL